MPAGGDDLRDTAAAFFDALMSRVLDKQEAMQQLFLHEIDRRARDQAAASAARDAAILSLLHKIAARADVPLSPSPPPPPPRQPAAPFRGRAEPEPPASSIRWSESEVEALIELLSGYAKPLRVRDIDWEEIAAEMRLLGYDRSGARCKQKWVQMNWYFKNLKDGRRRCPYFRHLDSFYRNNKVLPPCPSPLQARVPGQVAVGLAAMGSGNPYTTTTNNNNNNNNDGSGISKEGTDIVEQLISCPASDHDEPEKSSFFRKFDLYLV